MNGPQHFRAAEELAGSRGEWYYAAPEDVPAILARAQVHATLASAAATAMAGINHMDEDDFREWDRVAGVQPDVAES